MESSKTGRALDRNIADIIEDVRQDDIIVGITGSSGSRANDFVGLLVGEDIQASSRDAEIKAIRIPNFSQYGDRVVLILTPEFQDKSLSPNNVAQHIQRILKTMYPADEAKLQGLLCFSSTTDAHLLHAVTKIQHYQRLCGTDSLKRIGLVLTDSPEKGSGSIQSDDDLVETLANGVWVNFTSWGSQIHHLKSRWDRREVESIVTRMIGDAKDEDYAALKTDYDMLVETLEKEKIGKDVLNLLRGCFSQLHANTHDRSALAAEYLRAQDRFVKIATIIREELGIRSGERLLTFLVRQNPQFVTSGGQLRLSLRKPQKGNRSSYQNQGPASGGAKICLEFLSFNTRTAFIWIRKLGCSVLAFSRSRR